MHRLLALSILVLAAAAPARAETLSTSSFLVPGTQNTLCSLTNLGKKPVTVTIDHVDTDGIVVFTSTIEILPQASDFTSVLGFEGLLRCRFSGKLSGKSVRAVALVLDGSETTLSVPAQ